ncbi:MAG: outer membrane protein assembly factor BamA, partial [Pseudodesulfovibrio sp.]|uniref:outer membrane protein assembly factor BamA n=1 Tax=Pseudodesulfovibrio sp. TaxID=2035812 RepID=UPI003D10B331
MRGRKCTGLFLGLVAILSLALFGQEAMAQSGRGKAKVLVLPFKVNAPGDAESLRKSVSQQLSERLRKEGVAVVDSATAASVLKAKKVKEVTSARQARELARAAKASYAVMGSLSVVGDSLSLDAKSVNVRSSEESAAVYATGPGLIGLPSAVDDLAGKLKSEFISAASSSSPAGAPAAGIVGEKVAEVDVEGNNALEKDVVLLKVKTQVGEPFDSKTVNEDLKRLYDLGYFEDVQIRVDNVRGGKKVVFVVKEKPRIQAVGVNGAVEIKRDDILEAMSTKAGSVLNMQVLADDLEKIRELYRKKGYYQTQVTYSLEQTDPRMARLNIDIKEAKKLYIKEIRILGAKQVSVSDLKDEMGLKEKNFLSWIMQTGVLKEELLERDTAAIENYYTNHGFIDARVGQPQVDVQPDGIVLTFQVEEGDRYKVGEVGYRGDLLMDNEKLQTLTKMQELAKEKEFFDRSIVRADIARLTEAYSDMGYAFADCDVDMKKRGEEKIVDLTYIITKNQKVYVRRVTVEGNDKTRENVIRRELRLSDGDLFSGSKVKRSNERLNKLDYFEKVDVETVPTENPGEVDLRVRVKDKNTGSISAGVGYSTSDSVFFGGNIEERNLFGKGYAAQFSGMISGRTTRFVLSFTNPAVYDSKLSAGTDLYATKKQYDDFYKDAYGGDIR